LQFRTRPGVLNGSLRQAIGSTFFIGVGETIYNLHTYYRRRFTIDRTTDQFSQVIGLSYEIRQTIVLPHGQTLELRFGGEPVMQGVQYSVSSGTICPLLRVKSKSKCAPYSDVSAVRERAGQLDLGARMRRRIGRGDAIVGQRYLNDAAHYVAGLYDIRTYLCGDGQLADRNVGILPLIDYRLRL
jgi:hypothetical protein